MKNQEFIERVIKGEKNQQPRNGKLHNLGRDAIGWLAQMVSMFGIN